MSARGVPAQDFSISGAAWRRRLRFRSSSSTQRQITSCSYAVLKETQPNTNPGSVSDDSPLTCRLDTTKISLTLRLVQSARQYGRVAEWSIAAVLKTAEPQGSGGSNPSPSAMHRRAPPRNAVDGREAVRKGGIGAKPLALGSSPKRSASIPPLPPLDYAATNTKKG